MKKQSFLDKLKTEDKLKLVDPSEEICTSYLKKSSDCLASARILFTNNLFDNSVSMSYYAMYNSLTALLFKTGIKCENHSGSILILKELFQRNDLYKIISYAKRERIDKQYYVTSGKDSVITMKSASDLIGQAEDFIVRIKTIIKDLDNREIENIRNKFKSLENNN